MATTAEIDLVGEVLPVGMLKCKYALEKMAPLGALWVRTDDPAAVERVARSLASGAYRVSQCRRDGHFYRICIQKQRDPESKGDAK
jgi:TusA-related sulfurtransferase